MLLSLFILAEAAAEAPVETINITHIAAVVGALLIIARVVVRFTKNKKDDAAVEKVAGWLKVLRVVTGLNLKSGIDKYGPK